MTRKTLEEMKAAPAKFFMQLKEIAKHPEGFEGWERDDVARVARNKAARDKWVNAEVTRICGE